jgi:uncharacterized protein involved in outer membrane biogenesis
MKKKFLLRVVIVLVLLLVVAVIVVAFSLGAIVKKGVETYGPRATQVAVKLDSAQVWLVGGKAQLSGFFIGNPPGYTTPSAITVDKVSVSIQPGSVFSRKLIVDSIEVKAPVITLEGGLTDNNLKKIQKNLSDYNASPTNAPQAKPSSTGSPKADKALQVNDLVLTGAKLQFNTLLSGGKTVTLPLPDIHLTNLGTGPDGITAAEVAQQALDAVLTSAATAVTKNADSLGKGAVNAAKDAGKKASDLLKGLVK